MSAKVCAVCFEESPKCVDSRCLQDKKLQHWSVIRDYQCPRGHRFSTVETVAIHDDRRPPKR